jgi:hypothetical protein
MLASAINRPATTDVAVAAARYDSVTGPLEGTTLRGDGWRATLNSGWVVRPAARLGSFTSVREN